MLLEESRKGQSVRLPEYPMDRNLHQEPYTQCHYLSSNPVAFNVSSQISCKAKSTTYFKQLASRQLQLIKDSRANCSEANHHLRRSGERKSAIPSIATCHYSLPCSHSLTSRMCKRQANAEHRQFEFSLARTMLQGVGIRTGSQRLSVAVCL